MAMPSVARTQDAAPSLACLTQRNYETFPSKAQPKAERNSGGEKPCTACRSGFKVRTTRLATMRPVRILNLKRETACSRMIVRHDFLRTLECQAALQDGDPVVRMTDRGFRTRNKLVGLPFPAGDFGDLLESMMLRQSLLCDLVVSFYVFGRLHSMI